MAPQDVVIILICLILAPTILTTLLFVDGSTFTFVAAIRQQFKQYLAEQRGVSETSGRWDHVWTHMEMVPSLEQRPLLPQLSPLHSTQPKLTRRRAVDFTLSDSPDDIRSPFSFTSLSLFTQTPNSEQLRPLVLTEDSTWDYAFSMEDITFAFMTTAQRDWEAALVAADEERKTRNKKERIEAKKKANKGLKVNSSLWSIAHRLMLAQGSTGKTGTNKSL